METGNLPLGLPRRLTGDLKTRPHCGFKLKGKLPIVTDGTTGGTTGKVPDVIEDVLQLGQVPTGRGG